RADAVPAVSSGSAPAPAATAALRFRKSLRSPRKPAPTPPPFSGRLEPWKLVTPAVTCRPAAGRAPVLLARVESARKAPVGGVMRTSATPDTLPVRGGFLGCPSSRVARLTAERWRSLVWQLRLPGGIADDCLQQAHRAPPDPSVVTASLTAGGRRRRRLAVGGAFALLTVAASVLVARRLTHSSWPLDHAEPALVAAAAAAYLVSLVLRARAWHRLFPPGERPDQGRCLASVGASAASGAVLPFRLDYLIKIGMLQKLGGIRVGLGAIVLSIVSLGMID